MSSVPKCPSCSGVVPPSAAQCPHCDVALERKSALGKLALGVLGGLGASMTLMACYGAPASSCYETITLPDGGRQTDFVCGSNHGDAGTANDGGTPGDAGTTGTRAAR
jgi:hypothetical protein